MIHSKILYLLPAKWYREEGEWEFLSVPLCKSFLLTHFPCTSVVFPWAASSFWICISTCSSVGSSTGCNVEICSGMKLSTGCRETTHFTRICTTGCRRISAPESEAPSPPTCSLTLESAGLFLTCLFYSFIFFFSLSPHCCSEVLKHIPPRYRHLGCCVHPCPAVEAFFFFFFWGGRILCVGACRCLAKYCKNTVKMHKR